MTKWAVVEDDGYYLRGVHAVFDSEVLAEQEKERLENSQESRFCASGKYGVIEHRFGQSTKDFSPVS